MQRQASSMRIRLVGAFGVALMLTLQAAALAADGRRPVSAEEPRLLPLDRVERWHAPAVDVPALRAEDDDNRGRLGVPVRIGFPMQTDLSPSESGTWEDLEDGSRLWRLQVESPGAIRIVLGFDLFQLQPGAELWVYRPDGSDVHGPFTHADIRRHGELWFPPIAGDSLVVELHWPVERGDELPDLHLGTVSHGYKPFGVIGREADPVTEGVDDSGSCNIDVACPLGDDWRDQIRGAVILLSGGSGFCSGSLINTTADDCRPYVLTANHCGAGPSTTFGFNFEKPACGSGTPPPATNETVTGATPLASYAGSDFALLEMDAAPPESFGAYFNGWSREAAPAAESWGFDHPSGDVKKISHNSDPLIDGVAQGPNYWRVTEWEEGTTEGGSSGSPMFDPNHRIVGQLYGGYASCTNITWDEYGKVAASWAGGGSAAMRLHDWLDPGGSGAFVQDGRDHGLCLFQPAGEVTITPAAACSDTLTIPLRDDHLQGAAQQAVALFSDTEATPETVILLPVTPGAGTFVGSFATGSPPAVSGDGQLSIAHGDIYTVEYIDADDGQGGVNIVRQAVGVADCLPPAISNVQSNVLGTASLITWDTDEAADSLVTFGLTPPGSSTEFNPLLVTSHGIELGGLQECSDYVFSVTSGDAVGNAATDDDGGSLYGFETGITSVPEFDSADTPLAIPDNSPAGVASIIPVADAETVLDVDVRVSITHTYLGDLNLKLIAPNGTEILLAGRRGGSGDNYVDTVFDDDAATPISSGAAPFSGSFQPDSPLSAADGIGSAGDWQLQVEDLAGIDTGQIDSWTLILTFPSSACGPHAVYESHLPQLDACPAGGPGAGNGFWEPGEQVEFGLTVNNDGTDPLTGARARISSLTAGVTLLDDIAWIGDLGPGSSGASVAPHFIALLPAGLTCGQDVQLQVDIEANEGSWSSTFTQAVGESVQSGGTALDEDFELGAIPGGWTIVDGLSDGNTWYADNAGDPAGCGNTDPEPPVTGTWAAVDSDCADTVDLDEELVSPILDLTGAVTVSLEFDHWFRRNGAELADVDVRSSLTGGSWVNVAQWTGASTTNSEHAALDITAQAAGAADVQVRWHYHNANFEWTWFVDNVEVSYTAPSGCDMSLCAPTPGGSPPPIPDGSGGAQPLLVSLGVPDGSQLILDWDEGCSSVGTNLLYGPLDQVSTLSVSSSVCGVTGPSTWTSVPAGSLWFLLVGADALGVESSWGAATAGERNGLTASGECGVIVKDVAGSCP